MMPDTPRERLELIAQDAHDESDHSDFEHRGRDMVDALIANRDLVLEVLGGTLIEYQREINEGWIRRDVEFKAARRSPNWQPVWRFQPEGT